MRPEYGTDATDRARSEAQRQSSLAHTTTLVFSVSVVPGASYIAPVVVLRAGGVVAPATHFNPLLALLILFGRTETGQRVPANDT